MIRSLVSALLWCAAATLCSWAVRVAPPRRRIVAEVDGVTLAPISSLPREQILVPVAEWAPVLVAFPHEMVRA